MAISVSCAISLALFLLGLFVLANFDVLVFVCLIIFYFTFTPWKTVIFSNRDGRVYILMGAR